MIVDCGIQLRPEVLAFAQAMEAQLRENCHKPGWKGTPSGPLFGRIREELDELADALEQRRPAAAVLNEAADIGNFAMMIADCNGALPVERVQDALAIRAVRHPTVLSPADVEQWFGLIDAAAKRSEIERGTLFAALYNMAHFAYQQLRQIDHLERAKTRLETALTYYADPNHYDDETNAVGDHVTYQNFESVEHDFEADCGERAREALGVYIKETLETRR